MKNVDILNRLSWNVVGTAACFAKSQSALLCMFWSCPFFKDYPKIGWPSFL